MDALKIVQMALDAAAAMAGKSAGGREDLPDGESKNQDGSVIIRRSFRLDPAAVAENSHPSKQKSAAFAQPARRNAAPDDRQNLLSGLEPVSDADMDAIGYEDDEDDGGQVGVAQDSAVHACDEKGHDTPLENCKAQNPIFCPYHGIKAMQASFAAWMKHAGLNPDGYEIDFVKKPSGAFQLAVQCPAGTQNFVEEAIEGFLGQEGVIPVGKTENAPAKAAGGFASQMSAAFKTDKSMRPDDLSMMNEWMDSLYKSALDEDSVVDLDDLTELESKLAELNGTDQGSMNEDQKKHFDELLADAKDHYHAMKAKVDYKDIQSIDDAKQMGQILKDSFTSAKEGIAASYEKVKSEKKEAGFLKSPTGFPGNQEYNAMYKKVFGLTNADGEYYGDPSFCDVGKFMLADEALTSALAANDLDAAKKALHDMQFAKDEIDKHAPQFSMHADAMVANFKKAAELGLSTPSGSNFAEKKAWWEKMGVAYPDELKDISEKAAAKAEAKKAEKLAAAKAVAEQVVKKAAEAPAPAQPKGKAKKSKASKGKTVTVVVETTDESFLKPLAHDESKFPNDLTQEKLEAAIAAGKSAGGAGGLNTKRIEIDGKAYYCKSGSGSKASVIKNGYACDMAYRAGGVCAPDAKLYEFGGKTYKLSEAIDGKRLIDVWKGASPSKKAAVRQEILKGFPLDALFSNWDVLGTNMGKSGIVFDNVIVGEDGRCWRIDNDGAFGKTGTGGAKDLSWAKGALDGACDFEDWESKGGWDKREWIDDFRTMRLNPKNAGVFSEYSTADIFLAAGHCNMAAAVSTLPVETQEALKKPLHEMNQMARRAVMANISGYANNQMLSAALDASYEGSKRKLRELSTHKITWNSAGFGATSSSTSIYQKQDFAEPEPQPPKNPSEEMKSAHLDNGSYTGSHVSDVIISAAKTINHHCGFQAKEGVGTAQQSPDFTPNSVKIAEFAKISREKLEELAKTDQNAKYLLSAYDAIKESESLGWKKPVGWVEAKDISAKLPDGFKTKLEKDFEKNKAGAIAKYNQDHKAYLAKHDEWAKKKTAWDAKEQQKADASGKSTHANFMAFVKDVLETNRDTNGIAQHGGSVSAILASNDQKGDSWNSGICKFKVCELAMMGKSLADIKAIKDDDPLINNGAQTGSGSSDKASFMSAVKFYQDNPSQFEKDCRMHAMYKGLNVVKMENEANPLYHHDCQSVTLTRGEHGYSGKPGINKPKAKGACESAAFEANSWGSSHFTYSVPFWRVGYCYSNESPTGGGHGYHNEHEYSANLIGLTPFCGSGNYKDVHDAAWATKEFKETAAKTAGKIAPFMT